jgi:cytochrome oxidase assembly protein ShyY1
MTHYGYAFQWFAMAAAVLAILAWQLWKHRNNDNN